MAPSWHVRMTKAVVKFCFGFGSLLSLVSDLQRRWTAEELLKVSSCAFWPKNESFWPLFYTQKFLKARYVTDKFPKKMNKKYILGIPYKVFELTKYKWNKNKNILDQTKLKLLHAFLFIEKFVVLQVQDFL